MSCKPMSAGAAGSPNGFGSAALAIAEDVLYTDIFCPAIHLDDATVPPNLRHLEYFHDHLRIEAMLFSGVIQLSDGNLAPSDAPSNGYNLKTVDAVPYRIV